LVISEPGTLAGMLVAGLVLVTVLRRRR
jgi:hypothetical protein